MCHPVAEEAFCVFESAARYVHTRSFPESVARVDHEDTTFRVVKIYRTAGDPISEYSTLNILTALRVSTSSRVVGNFRRPPKTCYSSSESWENCDSEDVIRYAGKIRPFLKLQYLHNIRNYFFWPDLRRLPGQQRPNIWYVLVANMLESNPVVRNISEIHLRLHKLRCIPILTLHIQHGSHSPPPAASL